MLADGADRSAVDAGALGTMGLADGRDVLVRRAVTADLAGIIDFFERLSARSRYSRFFSPQPRMRRSFVEQVVAPGADRMTVIAQPVEFHATTRHVIGVGGWVWMPRERHCDVSVAVADAWQNVLLGTGIVLVLLQDAVAHGYTRFVADVLETNVRMLGLLDGLGARLRTRHESGVARVEFDLPASAERVAAAARGLADAAPARRPGRPRRLASAGTVVRLRAAVAGGT